MFNEPTIIALLGVDGSGKSTLMDNIREKLVKKNINYLSFHFAPSFFINRFEEEKNTTPYQKKEWPLIISFIKLFYLVLRYNFFINIYYRIFIRKFKVILFDRYFYDIAIDRKRYRVKFPRILILKLFRLIPNPNLIIFINTGLNNCKLRSNDKVDDYIRLKLNNSYPLLNKHCENFFEINGNQSIEEVYRDFEKIIRRLNQSLMKKYL